MNRQFDNTIEDSIYEIANGIGPMPPGGLGPLINSMQSVTVAPHTLLLRSAIPNELEYFVVNGILRTYVVSVDGVDTTLGFHVGPCVYTPSIARSMEGVSLVSCEALEVSEVVRFKSHDLISLMMQDRQVQAWGDSVLRAELIKRTWREYMLATMPGKERLAEFRKNFPDLEQRVSHPAIASYLGMSAVSLSRLRGQQAQ